MEKEENWHSTDVGDLEDAENGAQVLASALEDAIEWAKKAQDCLDVRSRETAEDRQHYMNRAGEARDRAMSAARDIDAMLTRLRAYRD